MNRFLQTALAILALVCSIAIGGVGFAAYGVVGKLGTSLDKLNLALDTVNRPCAPGPCGTLANADKMIIKVGDAIVTTQIQERATAPHVIAAMDTFRDAAIHLSGTADSLSGTAAALTGTARAATATIGTAGTTIAALQPLVGHVDSAVTSLDTSLQTSLLDMDAVLQHTEAITSSAAKVSDHFEKMIDAPKKHTFWGDVKAGWQIIWQVAMLAK
jgi:uncharacterized phage infection (PIP) family protein YhgE